MSGEGKGRVVAIVGRPNVGKSAIFNRLAGRRIAIVHAASGVTRDRLMIEATWDNERFELIDTGGIAVLEQGAAATVDGAIRAQVDAALADAAAAILVVDIETGLLPTDAAVAQVLHRSGCRAVVAANKADTAARDDACEEFRAFGFPVFPVSALHGRGFADLMDTLLPALPKADASTALPALKVAVVGRPNVGKSSYINRMLRSERVIVSDVAGTTRDSIDIPFAVGEGPTARHYRLIDTAGMRRTGKIKDAVERFSHFRSVDSIRRADVAVLMLDAEQGPTAHDRKIGALIQEQARGCVVVVNKWDLATETQRRFLPELKRLMPFLGYCPVVCLSSKTGFNVRRSIDAIDHVASQIRATIPTGILNRALEAAFRRVHAPAVKGRHLKLFYATQTGTAPLTFRLFVNFAQGVAPNYREYLVRSLREQFGLEGAPVRLVFTARSRPR